MTTEKEAKTKWCPFVRFMTRKGEIGNNRGAEPYSSQHDCNCVGSDCMAFRWIEDHKHIMSNGMTVISDKEDSDLCDGLWWDGKYPKNTHKKRLHQVIAQRQFGEIPTGFYVDHIDGDVLNNRRRNLRIVTPQQSGTNQKSRGGASKYRGVSKGKGDKWTVQLSSGGVRWCLGTYDTEHEAAAIYDKKAKEVHGEFARLNLITVENSGRQGYCGLAGKP